VGETLCEGIKVAGLYCRVSGREQVLGYSLDEQYRCCLDEARKHGIERHRVYRDEGKSGKTLNRDGLQRMLDHIVEGRVDVVITWKLDRLSRSMVDTLNLIQDLKEFGIDVISVTQQIDTSTVQGMMFVSMLAGFAQMEVENISERVKLGLEARRREGKWTGGAPYGFRYDPETGILVIEREEAEVVRLIYEKYLDKGTLHSVARYLNMNEIPTRKGNPWRASTVRRILLRPIYTGMNGVEQVLWNKVQRRMVGRRGLGLT